jgi:hypothetical protein
MILFFTVIPAFAQEDGDSEKRLLEREIKMSGLYLYGEAVGKDKSEATKLAKSMLTSEINKEVMNHPEWQFAKKIKADDIEYTTDMIDLARGNRTRVIAFLKKDNIQAIFSDNTPKIKLSDKKEDKKEKEQEVANITQEKMEEVTEGLTNTDNLVAEQSELLKSILDTNSATEINKILRTNKTKGKVAYGGINTLTDSSKVYILVYTSNNEIIAILDKGEGAERKDLRSGEYKNTADIYKGNMRIWFQLF